MTHPDSNSSRQEPKSTTEELKDRQLEVQRLEEQLRAIKIQEPTSQQASESLLGSRASDEPQSEWISGAKNAGKIYMLKYQPWAPKAIEGACPENTDPLDPDRYKTPQKGAACTLAEIWDTVPTNNSEHHDRLTEGNPKWKTAFKTGITTQRSALANKMKTNAHLAFPQFGPDFFARGSISRNTDEIQALLGYQPSTQSYSALPPLLFEKPGDGQHRIFRSEGVMRLAKIGLHGPASLLPDPPTTKGTLGKLIGATEATPSLMATYGIFARFLFSPDVEFAQIGTKSKIPYDADFHSYKRLLITSQSNPHIKKTFGMWNEFLFGPKIPAAVVPAAETLVQDDCAEDEITGLLNQLSDTPSDDEVPKDTTPVVGSSNVEAVPKGNARVGGVDEGRTFGNSVNDLGAGTTGKELAKAAALSDAEELEGKVPTARVTRNSRRKKAVNIADGAAKDGGTTQKVGGRRGDLQRRGNKGLGGRGGRGGKNINPEVIEIDVPGGSDEEEED
ncbi:hypothetical protein AAF712_013709 [Marasmius tenuissimus]|uniref:Uncharacterized protein n=1 Tax=Marasmius tenuissimus TaxID=585030 RepID=A0ABR2ZE04_9AGAR